jgi:2-amino-4-hydroxy-6-hydroxymethyldihydropteridine diphosphokinase
MRDVFVGVGSNADPAAALRAAVAALEERFGRVSCSSVYRSAAVGVAAADYLNAVVRLTTAEPITAVRDALRAIEANAGRRRLDAAVTELDLDLLLYGSRVDALVRVPRPGLFAMPFVLGPLAELAPGLVHPVTGERCEAAWQAAPHGALVRVGALRARPLEVREGGLA